MSIRIDKEFESLIPPLSEDEFRQLEENCVREGIRDPLVVWHVPNGDDILIDGHNRFKISVKHHGIRFDIKRMTFDLREDAIAWIIRNQLGRRNLDVWAKFDLQKILEPIEKAEAKKRQGTRTDITPTLAESKKGETRDKMAKQIGVSHGTYQKMKAIDSSDNENVKQAVRSGEMSINQAYLNVKGFTDKSPKQLHKEFIGRVEKKREDYKEQKKNGIVSIKDANADKENAKILANELYSRCMKMGDAIGSVYLDHKEGTINLKELATTLSPEDLRSLRESLGEDRKRLLIIIAEVFG